jgi:hypothetical protein
MLILALSTSFLFGQFVDEYVEETNFFIPSAPAFTMLNVTPELVTRPGAVREFKVDWRIKNYNIAPDLALEAQPVWFLYYDRHDLNTYRRASPLMKTLSTLSFSFATAKIDGVNHMSVALKLNLYREKDPMMDNTLIAELQREVNWDEEEMIAEIRDIQRRKDFVDDKEVKRAMRDSISDLRYQLKMIRQGQKDRLRSIQEEYVLDNWNASMLDLAFGRVWTYNNGGLDSLKMQGAGYALWLNGSLRMGKHGQGIGLLRFKRSGFDNMVMLGLAYRYGGPKYNFFVETVYETTPDYLNATLSDEEIFAGKVEYDLGFGWLHYDDAQMRSTWTLSYGGDFRLNRNILLNFALRTRLDGNFKFTQLLPVANLTCLMR